MFIETYSDAFRKARSVNQTSNGFVSKVPTITEPSGDAGTATGASVFDLGTGGITSKNLLLVCPYAIGADNDTFSVRVLGWRKIGTGATALWIPVVLVELACTCSSAVGVAGMDVLATERFADTITLTTGNANVSNEIVSPTGNVIAHAVLDTKGFTKGELSFTTGGSATSCNALLAMY